MLLHWFNFEFGHHYTMSEMLNDSTCEEMLLVGENLLTFSDEDAGTPVENVLSHALRKIGESDRFTWSIRR